jgi:spermidine/putrescine-binding protein
MSTNDTENSGLVRTRAFAPMTRRGLLRGAGAIGGLAAVGLPAVTARAGATVRFVGWEGYDVFLEGGGFLEANDITMEKTFISAPEEVVAKLRLQSDQYDVSSPYFIHVDFMVDENLLEPLDLDKIPNFKKIDPAILRMSEGNMTVDGVWYSCPFVWGTINLMYNADRIANPPTSWLDMLKDEYKGKCAIPNDYPGVLSIWGRVATGTSTPNWMTHEELDKTVAFLIKMKKEHLRTIASSYGELVDLLAREEVIIAQGFEPVAAWVGESPLIKWVYPKEGALSFIEGFSIGRGTPNADVDHALINNALSVEGQLAGAEFNGMPVVIGEAVPLLSEWNRNAYPYDDVEGFFATKATVDPMYYLESDGVHATWDEYIDAWERVLKG